MSDTWEEVMADTAADDRQARFEELQSKLVPLWESIRALNQDEQTIVVAPSITLDSEGLSGSMMQAYEERFLFLLLLLRQPKARLVYVTSQMILPSIIDYYLDLLPGVISTHARRRLFLPSPLDGSPGPLSQKLLARPRLLERIRALIPDPDRAHLVPYNTTELERDIAVALGIPMYGADPKHFHLGTKSGCRQLFAEEGLPHPLGFEDLRTSADVVEALSRMREAKPDVRHALVKLNEGVSGEGNALVDLEGLPPPGGT
ncbi:MAG: peptide ligase PGM1-related protein, partial [Actinomycetota bacterium]